MLDSLLTYAKIMVWSYYTRTYSDCRPSIVLSVLPHVKHFKAVFSVKTKTKANLSRKQWLNYNFNNTTVYAHIVIACDGPNIRLCAKSDNTAMTTVLMVI